MRLRQVAKADSATQVKAGCRVRDFDAFLGLAFLELQSWQSIVVELTQGKNNAVSSLGFRVLDGATSPFLLTGS